jgi:glyoxylase-like metal-dependent hydrolase (beta-lactamase superfamily II)
MVALARPGLSPRAQIPWSVRPDGSLLGLDAIPPLSTLQTSVMNPHIEMLTVGPLAVNCYLVGDPESRGAVVIDPGDEAERILATVADGSWRVSAIVLTHAHFDHVLAVREVKEATGAPFLLPPGEVALLKRAPEVLEQWMGMRIDPPPDPDGHLSGGDTLDVGNLRYNVVGTPGHSPDAICLIGESEAFVGDTLFAGSIGRTDLPGADHQTLMDSIARELLPLDDEMVLYPGHGPKTTMGRERRFNPFVVDLVR